MSDHANLLYYGDNLDVLRRHIDDASIDLIYLDPPFNSNADYNVLFAEKDGTKAHAQIQAFEDTWQWDLEAAQEYAEVLRSGHDRVAKALRGMHDFLGGSDMLAYLSMMALRLIELRRVLKPTGAIYLHCDPTASHYLKILMDSVFGPENFVNEIIWKRTSAHADSKQGSKHYGRLQDVILYFAKDAEAHTFNQQYTGHDPDYVESHYRNVDADGRRYRWDNLTGPGGAAKGNPFYECLGVEGYWRYSKERMEKLIGAGLVAIPPKGAKPALKRYLDAHAGTPVGTIWTDLSPINSQAKERLGYPTQKPESLLERIVLTSSNAGDTVLDPFCGCGTTIAAAQKLDRRWIGIDITHIAITLIKSRLLDAFGPKVKYKVIGEPADLASAQQLAGEDQYQFQWWALGLVGARPVEQKKGADKGIDGKLPFNDSADATDVKHVVFSVKAGHLHAAYVRDLRGVIERESAAIGVLITMEPPTKKMREEAASAGVYSSRWDTSHPRLQILTIEELLKGRKIDMPAWHEPMTFKKAPKAKGKKAEDARLF